MPFPRDRLNLLIYSAPDGAIRVVRSPEDWEQRRAQILANMQLVMGEHPDEGRRVPLHVEVLEEAAEPTFIQRKVTFAVEDGDRVPAYLLVPNGLSGPAPAVLCLHQTTAIGKAEPTGLGGMTNLHYAKELAERGYVCLAPDYPGYGGYEFDAYAHGYASTTMKGIWNHERAVDLMQSLPEVDGERMGCIGHSLGGHNTLFVAAFDERIKVAVSSGGFSSFYHYRGHADLAGWSHDGYMPRIASVYGNDPARMPFDFHEVLAAIAPRAVFANAPLRDLYFDADSVRECIEAARPVFALLGAEDDIVGVYPDCEHDFPPEGREEAYGFVDGVLGR